MGYKKISDLTERVILTSLAKSSSNNVLLYRVSKIWHQIIGDEMGNIVRPHAMLNDGLKGYRIVLKVQNHAHMVEIQMYKSLIKQRLNIYLGNNAINTVDFIV